MNRLFKFALTGLAGTLLDFTVFTFALVLTGNSTLSRATGYAFGTLWAFLLNRSWVFQSASGTSRLIPFVLLYLATGAIAVTIQWGFGNDQIMGVGVFVAYGLSIGVASTINFFGMRYLVFGKTKGKTR